MIKEAYCSFEVAKLLKEKGFNENTEHKIWYVIKQYSTGCHWNSCIYKVGNTTREYNNDCCISMPTHQMAIAWLREKHIVIVIHPEYFNADSIVSYWGCDIWINDNYERLQGEFTSYEGIVEAALKYVLENLI